MAYTFRVDKIGSKGTPIETTYVRDRGYTQAARQVVGKRGYKVAQVHVSRPDHPSAGNKLSYYVRKGEVKFSATVL